MKYRKYILQIYIQIVFKYFTVNELFRQKNPQTFQLGDFWFTIKNQRNLFKNMDILFLTDIF